MNPLTLVKRIQKINSQEASLGISEEASWHAKYKDSAYVFVGGIPYDLTEGDLLAVFAQYGEIVDVNLVRDKGTGKSKGFAFVAYEDQRSTNLAVGCLRLLALNSSSLYGTECRVLIKCLSLSDNLNGAQILGRIVRVDHVTKYKKKEEEDEETEQKKREARGVCRAFQRGECTRGAGCKFSHDEQRAANTGWGAAEDASSKWGHDKFDDPKDRDRELRAKGRKNIDDLESHLREISGRARQENKLKGWDGGKESELKLREDHGGKDEKRLRRHDPDGNRELKSGDDRYKREEKRSRRNHDDREKEANGLRRHGDDDDEMKLEDEHHEKEERRSRRNLDDEHPPHSRRDYNTREEDRSKRHGDEEYQPKLREDDDRRERDKSVRHRSESRRRENPDEKRDSQSSQGRGRDHSHRERNEDRRR